MLRFNNRGFTLVEVMVAIVIILVGLLGLLQAVGFATLHNLNNQLREEAVLIGETQMADLQRRPFSMMSSIPPTVLPNVAFSPRPVASRIRGTSKGYTVTRGGTQRSSVSLPDGTTSTYELFVQVIWTVKNSNYSHEVRTLRVYRDGI